jgi:hypothetical protein
MCTVGWSFHSLPSELFFCLFDCLLVSLLWLVVSSLALDAVDTSRSDVSLSLQLLSCFFLFLVCLMFACVLRRGHRFIVATTFNVSPPHFPSSPPPPLSLLYSSF